MSAGPRTVTTPGWLGRWRTPLALLGLLVATDITVLALSSWPVDEGPVRAGYFAPLPADVAEYLRARGIELSPVPDAPYRERTRAVLRGDLDVIIDYENGRVAIRHDPQRTSSVLAAYWVDSVFRFYNLDRARTALRGIGVQESLLEPLPARSSEIPGEVATLHLFLGMFLPALLVAAVALGVIAGGGGPARRAVRGALFALAMSVELFLVLPGTDFHGLAGISERFDPWGAPWLLVVLPVVGSPFAALAAADPGDRVRVALTALAGCATLLVAAALFDPTPGAWIVSRIPLIATVPALVLAAGAALVRMRVARSAA